MKNKLTLRMAIDGNLETLIAFANIARRKGATGYTVFRDSRYGSEGNRFVDFLQVINNEREKTERIHELKQELRELEGNEI